MYLFQAFATSLEVPSRFLWPVPAAWSLRQAATVPLAYITAYYALVVRGQIRPGQRVLIHAGSGGVGQAAIAVALDTGCDVYTTVSTDEKGEFLKRRFPQLQDSCFANSRDTSFEKYILRATDGYGVDLVLNSLAGDQLQASLAILAEHGKFLEIGKYDLSADSKLGVVILSRLCYICISKCIQG